MKKLKFLLLGALTASLAGALAACAGDGGETYTFTFDSKGGTAIAALELEEGAQVTRPADPTKKLFTFDDWYADEALSTVYTFDTMPAQDVTVYAKWLPETNVRITYDLMYDAQTGVPDSIGLIGSVFEMPDSPTRTGYVFGGWYTDAACTTAYAFTTFPEENMTLYAKWLPDGAYAYITYYGNGVQLADPFPVEKGTQFVDLADRLFGEEIVTDGWYTNADRTNRYAGGTVTGDLNLYTTYYTQGLTFSAGTVTGYRGTARQVVVPDQYNFFPVTSIGAGAFRGTDVRSVLLPDAIAQVGSYAFSGCRYLTTVNLTENLTAIGAYAFANAQRLESYGTLAVAAIPEGLFLGCTQLDTAVLGGEPVSIGAFAFADCTTLQALTVPDSVTSIGAQAFDGCSALTALALPASLATLGENALLGCTALSSVTIAAENTAFSVEDGNLYEGTRLVRYLAGEKGETSFTLPADKTAVAAYAFENNATLTSLTLGGSTAVAASALKGMTALTSLTLPAAEFEGATLASFFGAPAAETSGSASFYIPATLTSVTLTGGLTAIAPYAFYGATGLSSVEGIDGVTSVGDGAFAYTAIASYVIPATVTSFGARVFEGCGIEAYEAAEGNPAYHVTDGCLYAEDGTLVAVPAGKTEVTVEAGTTAIGAYAFYDSAVETLVIPDTVTSIGFAALGNMQSLTSLTLPFIGDGDENAYMGYTFGVRMRLETPEATSDSTVYSTLIASLPARLPANLQTLEITKPVTEIADMAFANLKNLASVTFPEGTQIVSYGAFSFYNTAVTAMDFSAATKIGESAFEGADLVEIDLPGTLADGIGTAAFAENESLTRITFGEGITRLPADLLLLTGTSGETGEDGYSYDVRRSKIDCEVVIPASVTEIGSQAFLGMGTAAFYSPTYPDEQPDAYTHATRNENFSLTFAEGSKLTEIGSYAFSCSGVQQLRLPASLETVGQNAFVYNLFLTDVTFGSEDEGSAIATLGAYVFSGDAALERVTIYAESVPQMTVAQTAEGGLVGITFYQSNDTFLLFVPARLVYAYRNANGWQDLGERIVEIGAEGGNA